MNIKNPKLTLIFIIFTLTACESLDIVPHETDLYKEKLEADGKEPRSATPIGDLFPEIFGNSNTNIAISITYDVALEKFSIMPIITADKSSGIITTDWYSTSTNTNERFKFNVIVKDNEMTNQSLIINMFKEKIDGGVWKTTAANIETAEKIKQSILKKSRQLKSAAEMS
jgi:hypothetical protein